MSRARWTPGGWKGGGVPLAVITGASSGIGAEYAAQLAELGMGLVLVARRRDRLEELGERLARTYGASVEIEVCDLADRPSLEALAVWLARRDDIDLMVSNAGIGLVGRFVTSDPARLTAQLDLHVIASTRLTRAVLPQMVARRRGAVVQVSSVAGFFPRLSSPTYGSSKAYLNGLSESLLEEMVGSGICFQSLCPGFTRTEFHSTPEFEGIDVHAAIPEFLWLTAAEVVRESIAGLAEGKRIVIPGRGYRWLALLGGNKVLQGIASRLRAARRKRRAHQPGAAQ